ncbi:hypothetical protein ACFQWF_14655 [Methylorubrum suomiense]
MPFGTTPTGFVRKPLTTALAEIEEKAREIFGPGVIQTPQSPLGQLNGFAASIITTAWEMAEDVYQSYDPDQAEGIRLEQLGRIRLLERMDGETDPAYRQAITNEDRARIDLADINRAIAKIDGVSYVQVFVNPADAEDADGVPGHSIAVAVIGGDDEAIARAIRPYVVPGVNTYGNSRVDIDVEGYCRTMLFIRPTPIRMGLQLVAKVAPDRLGCPRRPPLPSALPPRTG